MVPKPQPESDSGARLRSLYLAEGGVRSIFSTRVADYVASRPDYPAALFDALAVACGLTAGAIVADVGAGTGLLTQGLLRKGWQVIAVEPNPEMRAAADHHLGGMAGYRSVDGCAEAMPLEPASVDLITVAQAFHWFNAERARTEFLRVLTPQGKVALIWNDRDFEDQLQLAFDQLAAEFGGAKRAEMAAREKNRSEGPQFFGDAQLQEFCWPHAQQHNEEGLLALIFSRSYIPGRSSPDGRKIADRIRKIFQQFEANGTVEIRYRTVAIVGRPR